MRQIERVGEDEVVLWKMNLREAFTLLCVEGKSVKKLAFQQTDDLTMLHTTGMFGWTGMPFAFQVITRILERIINPGLKGECLLYVDAIFRDTGLCEGV
jgi:hypothetical protein